MKTRVKAATLVLVVTACGQSVDRRAELDACRLISKSGDELARCLVMKYSWRAESAGPAKTAFQWELDSIRQAHEAQVAAIIAAQLRDSEAATAARERRVLARARAEARRDSIDQEIIGRANLAKERCSAAAWEHAVRPATAGGGHDMALFDSLNRVCQAARDRAVAGRDTLIHYR